uniref:Uncharacterized protein n=1 Tax=Panthera leo TaxID=9689 RepID=A0A8C8XW58_PANLE
MFNPTNSHRPLSSHTLHIRHDNRFLISYPHLPRCKLWLNYPVSTRQRSLHILYLPLHACRTRNILWLLHFLRNMKHWNRIIVHSHGYSLHRICLTVRPNILLRSNRNHQPPISNPIHWDQPSRVDLRRNGIRLRQNSIPPILHNQRYPRPSSTNLNTHTTRPILTRPIRRPR